MIIGSNPRREAPVLNARIRKRWRHCEPQDRGHRRARRSDLRLRLSRRRRRDARRVPRPQARRASSAKIWLVGQGALARPDGAAVLVRGRQGRASRPVRWSTAGTASRCCIPRPRGSAVSTSASCRARSGLAAAAMAQGGVDVLFLLGADEIEVEPGAFVVYIGTHGDRGAHRADVILPGAAYTEKAATYVNTEGRVQRAGRAAFPPGDAREDWAILRALSDVLGQRLPLRLAAAAAGRAVPRPSASRHAPTPSRPAAPTTCARSRRSAAASTRRRSSRPSRTSISPIRSRGRPR